MTLLDQRAEIDVCEPLTLHECSEDSRTGLQQRVTNHNLQKSLQAFPSLFNDSIVELVEVDLPWKRRYRDPRAFSLQDVPEVFEVAVSPSNRTVAQFKAWDVGGHGDQVGSVSRVRSQAMSLRVLDLYRPVSNCVTRLVNV